MGVWALVLLSNTIAEVQGFQSSLAGLGNLFLAGAVVVVPVVVLVVTVLALKRP